MEMNDQQLWKAAYGAYGSGYNKNGQRFSSLKDATIVDSTSKTTNHVSFESNGLQASLLKIDGQYIVTYRGSTDLADFKQDGDLINPNAAESSSQFKDAQAFIEQMKQLHPDFDPSQATYTGHSLGAALASYSAIKYNAKATVFSAPSCYNELNETE